MRDPRYNPNEKLMRNIATATMVVLVVLILLLLILILAGRP